MKHIILTLTFLPFFANAQLQLAKIFSDNMVLQRDKPIHIWGRSAPGQTVALFFGNENKRVITKPDSSWSVYFKKQKANPHPQSIFIKSEKENIELKNILIGDVWICSGQSNMEWMMQKEMYWKEEVKNAEQPLIRFTNPPPAGRYVYGVAYTDSLNKRMTTDNFYLWEGWKQCDSNSLRTMSAIAWYFAKQIVQQENIPIGLINLSIGGAPIETFISKEALAVNEKFSVKVKGDWLLNDNLPAWVRERGMQNVGRNANGYRDELGLNHAYKPGFAFEAGIRPLLSMPVTGIIWYQGESNSLEAARVEEYRELQKLMIENYREQWKQPSMPFYWVQLSSIDTTNYPSKYWPQFRDEQRLLLNEVENGGMAVSSDIGKKNDVHPTNKKFVGDRLARWALFDHYGRKHIIPSGPLAAKAKYKKGRVFVSFRNGRGLRTKNASLLKGFSLDGINPTPADIQRRRVVIVTKSKPAFIYYGWQPFTDANLVNAQQLPASTFKLAVD
jgi:sialate O-acetylesterase